MPEGIAGLGRRQQPFERKIDVTRNAPAIDETAANLRLGTGIASVPWLTHTARAASQSSAARCTMGDGHRLGRVGAAGRG